GPDARGDRSAAVDGRAARHCRKPHPRQGRGRIAQRQGQGREGSGGQGDEGSDVQRPAVVRRAAGPADAVGGGTVVVRAKTDADVVGANLVFAPFSLANRANTRFAPTETLWSSRAASLRRRPSACPR